MPFPKTQDASWVQTHDFSIRSLTLNHKATALPIQNCKKVQVGKDQEKAQSEKDSHSKNRGGKKPN